MMTDVVAAFLATVVTVPILGWYLIYIITVKATKNKPKSIRLASDGSAVFFIAAVYFISYELWGRSFLGVILALFFLLAFFFTIAHWKISGDIYTTKLLKGIWRLNFMIFFFIYIVLSAYGLMSRII